MKKRLAAGIAGLFALTVSAAGAGTTSCSTVAACVFGSNSSSGIGVEGSSKSGFGVSGVSTSGHGVNGTSASSFGVVGITTVNATSTATARAGVLGEDSSTNKTAYNSGVAGMSKTGYGVSGSGAIGVYGSGSTGIYGVGTNIGAFFQGGVYVQTNNNGGAGTSFSAYSGGSGTMIQLQTIDASADLFAGYNKLEQAVSIDATGNEILRGSLTMDGSPKLRTHSSMGTDVVAFGAETATPSIEDFGKAQLRNGVAYVSLDRTFASTIDLRSAYLVFITPEGDSNGLYTDHLSATGFAVHENRRGHSSLIFDYRIVAKPSGAKVMHLPAMSQFRQLSNHAPVPKAH